MRVVISVKRRLKTIRMFFIVSGLIGDDMESRATCLTGGFSLGPKQRKVKRKVVVK